MENINPIHIPIRVVGWEFGREYHNLEMRYSRCIPGNRNISHSLRWAEKEALSSGQPVLVCYAVGADSSYHSEGTTLFVVPDGDGVRYEAIIPDDNRHYDYSGRYEITRRTVPISRRHAVRIFRPRPS